MDAAAGAAGAAHIKAAATNAAAAVRTLLLLLLLRTFSTSHMTKFPSASSLLPKTLPGPSCASGLGLSW
jgi:hypothetical protein